MTLVNELIESYSFVDSIKKFPKFWSSRRIIRMIDLIESENKNKQS